MNKGEAGRLLCFWPNGWGYIYFFLVTESNVIITAHPTD